LTIFKKREKWIRENLTLDLRVRKQKKKALISQDQTRVSVENKRLRWNHKIKKDHRDKKPYCKNGVKNNRYGYSLVI